MGSKRSDEVDWEKRNSEIAIRLRRVREHLKFTQAQFGYQLGISRERMASYEDGRTPLRCDVGIRICRYYFVNEFWLAYGAVDEAEESEMAKFAAQKRKRLNSAFGFDVRARLTMALAGEPIALSLPTGLMYSKGFDQHLRIAYLRLAKEHGEFPRIILLPNEPTGYLTNATLCMMDFWESGVGAEHFNEFFFELIQSGEALYSQYKERQSQGNPSLSSWFNGKLEVKKM